MISRLFVRHPHLGLQGAQLARRVLLFHRGSGLVTKVAPIRRRSIRSTDDRWLALKPSLSDSVGSIFSLLRSMRDSDTGMHGRMTRPNAPASMHQDRDLVHVTLAGILFP